MQIHSFLLQFVVVVEINPPPSPLQDGCNDQGKWSEVGMSVDVCEVKFPESYFLHLLFSWMPVQQGLPPPLLMMGFQWTNTVTEWQKAVTMSPDRIGKTTQIYGLLLTLGRWGKLDSEYSRQYISFPILRTVFIGQKCPFHTLIVTNILLYLVAFAQAGKLCV